MEGGKEEKRREGEEGMKGLAKQKETSIGHWKEDHLRDYIAAPPEGVAQ